MTRRSQISMRLIAPAVGGVLLMGLLIGGGFLLLNAVRFSDDITDPTQYASACAAFGPRSSRIPRSIPPMARDVELLYHPAMLQGGACLELRFSLSPADVSNLLASMSSVQELNAVECEWAKSAVLELARDPIAGHPKLGEPATDLRVFIFYTAGHWNHGKIEGVVIEPGTGYVHYFAQAG